jgi:hypothetical protein
MALKRTSERSPVRKKLGFGSAAALALVFAVSVFVALKVRRLTPPLKVAVADSGFDPSLFQGLESRLLKTANGAIGVSLLEPGAAHLDATGHGTRVLERVARACPGCGFHVIKITQSGGALRPSDYAAAIRWSLEQGVRILVIPSGLTQASPELEAAAAAARGKLLLVAPAGVGVANPFRPQDASTLWPQGFPETLVFGVVNEKGQPDPAANFGPKIDAACEVEEGALDWGSSLASGTCAGIVAQALKSGEIPAETGSVRGWISAKASPLPRASSAPWVTGSGLLR